MGLAKSGDVASRFSAYVEGLASVIGHADRAKPLRDYCTGLMMPCERKSVEPMAAMTAPERTAAQHQSLLHFVGQGDWSDERCWPRCARWCCRRSSGTGRSKRGSSMIPAFPRRDGIRSGWHGNIAASFGKQDNCQVAVTLSVANHHASLPVAYRLYLPKEWATDRTRRRKAGVPKEITFKTKPEIALDQIAGPARRACRAAWC